MLLAACGQDEADTHAAGGSGGSSATSSSPSGGTAGAGGSATTAGGSSASGGSGTGGQGGLGTAGSAGWPGLDAVGSLVILGDSIGDGGGVGPYYYTLLRQSLQTRYGPIEYRNEAEGGSKTSALVGQINDLPGSLPGPVAVAITSGGNDMKDRIVEIIAGVDAPFRQAMGANITAALEALLAPGRFGSGVQVHVFEANIYDSSDGEGDFGQHDCAFSFPVALPTDGYFANWNGEIATRVQAQGQRLVDMHGHFYGHGFNNPPNWYHTDCTHPNSTGHDQLHRLFYLHITGEVLP